MEIDLRDITVVIPAYNASQHIRRAIQSSMATGIERIIVVDDGSTDATADVAGRQGCLVITQSNQGAAYARMSGLEATETTFVIFLDADDELDLAGFLQITGEVEESDGWSGIHGLSLCISSDGSTKHMGGWPEGVDLVSLLERGICPGPAGSFLWRTSEVKAAITSSAPRALWPRFGEDYEMLLRVAMRGRILQHKSVLCRYTLSGGKSAVSPFRDNIAAERIRRYYARANDIPIRNRGLNEIKSMAHLRDLYALPADSHVFVRLRHLAAAIRLAPLMFPRLVLRRVSRHIRASLHY